MISLTCFNALRVLVYLLYPFQETLTGFSREQVDVRGWLDLWTTFSVAATTKTVLLRCMVANTASPYNIFVGRLALNAIEVVVSYAYLCVKYPISSRI